jgi:YD repeat-containing protein
MTATVPVKFPSNHRNDPTIVGGAYSFAEVDLLRPATGNSDRCGNSGDVIRQDLGFATVTAGVTCADPAASRFTLFFTSCPQLSCENGISRPLDFAKAAGCPAPIPESCNESGGTVAGASGPSCPICRRTGGDAGCAVSIVGVLACADNANEGIDHVWLITRGASFREFTNLAAGSGLRLYQGTAPSDEYRKLYYDTASGAWQLKGLDGSVEFFRSDGRWSQTIVPSDPAHPTVGIYDTDGQLARVTFPDGRSEDYTYYAVGGKLKTITENTVGGVAARTWTYLWSDDHLTGI